MSVTHVRRSSPRLPKWSGDNSVRPGSRPPRPDFNVPATPGKEMETDSHAGEALELIRQRSAPALFIVGPNNKLLYANDETLQIFKDSKDIPVEVQQLCDRIRAGAGDAPFASPSMNCEVFRGPGDDLYSLRGFLVEDQENAPLHVMVLVEKVAERGAINLKKAKERFGLSDREIEVVMLVAQGLCNKDIGAKLYVSEHTVKGHLKNITRKVGAESRGSIIAILK